MRKVIYAGKKAFNAVSQRCSGLLFHFQVYFLIHSIINTVYTIVCKHYVFSIILPRKRFFVGYFRSFALR